MSKKRGKKKKVNQVWDNASFNWKDKVEIEDIQSKILIEVDNEQEEDQIKVINEEEIEDEVSSKNNDVSADDEWEAQMMRRYAY